MLTFEWEKNPVVDSIVGLKDSAARIVMLKAGTCYLKNVGVDRSRAEGLEQEPDSHESLTETPRTDAQNGAARKASRGRQPAARRSRDFRQKGPNNQVVPRREGHYVKHAASSGFETATAAFHEALRTNDAQALFAYVADDVLLMPPGEGAVRGKSAMRDWYGTFLSQYTTSSLTLSNREVFVGDQWAVELGSYEWGLTPAVGGDVVLDRGNYMQLWKSWPDGHWRFEREIWNSSAPVTPPE
jgi:ketosteroid isomerase-like protein